MSALFLAILLLYWDCFFSDVFSSVLGGYLVTQKDQFFNRGQFCQLAAVILAGKDNNISIDLPPPAIMKVMLNCRPIY